MSIATSLFSDTVGNYNMIPDTLRNSSIILVHTPWHPCHCHFGMVGASFDKGLRVIMSLVQESEVRQVLTDPLPILPTRIIHFILMRLCSESNKHFVLPQRDSSYF